MKRIVSYFKRLNQIHGSKLDHWWLGYAICGFGFALTILAFFPGFMSPDSIANLDSGRSGYHYDINAPVMGWLWGLLDAVIPGPAPMLILQNLVFWGASAIFWQTTAKRSSKLGICLVLLGFMPQILSHLSTIWKDVGLAASLFFAASALYSATATKSKMTLVVTPLFLFYAMAARLNAFPAVLPLAIWTGVVVCRVFDLNFDRTKRFVFVGCFGGLYFLGLAATAYFINYGLTAGRTVYPFQQVMLYDLAAVSKDANEPLFPEYILRQNDFSFESVKAAYNVRSVNALIYGDRPVLNLTGNPDEIASLERKWKEVVIDHPHAYIVHRSIIFAQLTGLTRHSITTPYWALGFEDNPPEFRAEPNLLNRTLMNYFSLFRKLLFFHGFFWSALSLCALYLAVRNRVRHDWQIVFFLSLSSLLYTAAYFPTTPSTEFRYILWSSLASAASVIFAVYELRRSRP